MNETNQLLIQSNRMVQNEQGEWVHSPNWIDRHTQGTTFEELSKEIKKAYDDNWNKPFAFRIINRKTVVEDSVMKTHGRFFHQSV